MPIETGALLRLAARCLVTTAIASAAQSASVPAVAAVDAVIPQPTQTRASQGVFVLPPRYADRWPRRS